MAATANPGTRPVRLIRRDVGTLNTTQTPGIERREIISTPGAWVGVARTQPGVTSGWHHHGDYETYIYVQAGRLRMEFGPGGRESCEAGPGDFLVVPRGAVHRESNTGADEQVIVLVRVGSGEPAFNVDGPAL